MSRPSGPPARPWSRLPSMFRPAAPTPAPPPPAPTVRPAAPAPAPAPAPTPIPTQEAIVRPALPETPRPPTAPAQTMQPPQEPIPPPPRPTAAPPAPTVTQRSPSVTPAPVPSPPKSPVTPTPTTAPARRSPVVSLPPQPSPPKSPVSAPATAASAPQSRVVSSPPAPSQPKPPVTATLTTAPVSRSPVASQPPIKTDPSEPKITVIQTSASLPTSPAQKESPRTFSSVTVTSSSLPASPKTTVPTSPVSKSVVSPPKSTATPRTTVANHSAARVMSPEAVKPLERTPAQSPKIKPISHPPSPLTLPPAQVKADSDREAKIPAEVEQKNVLVHQSVEKPKMVDNSYNKGMASNGKKETTKDKGTNKKHTDSEEFGVRVITLAGENKGATMELSPARKKNSFLGIPRSLHKNGNAKAWSDGEKSSSDGSEEGKSKDKSPKTVAAQSPPMTAFMNSNVQAINNSILYNCSCTHHDPGVHLSVSRNANGSRGIHLKDHRI